MADRPSELVQGTLEMLVLKTLALEPIHGYGIALRIDQMSGGVFHVNPGSLFLPSAAWSAPAESRRSGGQPRTIAGPSITCLRPQAEKRSKKKLINGENSWLRSTESWKPEKNTWRY